MHEVALDLCLTRAPQIRTLDPDGVERTGAEQRLVRADDFRVLQRERVERAEELLLGQDQRRRDAFALPAVRSRRACLEICGRQAADEREAGERLCPVKTVGDDRPQPIAEDAAERRDETIARPARMSSHIRILGYAAR